MDTILWSAEPESLLTSEFVARVNQQYGPYRDINEESLRHETLKASIMTENSPRSRPEELRRLKEDSTEESPEATGKLKSEALADVLRAQSDAAYGRDFVSYLLTRDGSGNTQAHLTISPEVKEQVPPASLGREVVQLESADNGSQLRSKLSSGGVELETLKTAVDSIVSAAEQLEKEIRLETQYWQDITKIESYGWSICRMPQQRQCLAVRVGCIESGSAYRGKGLVKLQRSATGAVELNLSGDVARGRQMRARLQRKSTVLASSSSSAIIEPDTGMLQHDLLRARDSLFDEELFYELSREAGQLWNRGIKYTDSGIVIPFEAGMDLILDLVEPGHAFESSPSAAVPSDSTYSQWPDASLAAVRILFCHAHREARNKRAAVPRPINGKHATDGAPRLLLPFILRAQTQTASREIGRYVYDMKLLLNQAKLDVTVNHTSNSQYLTELLMPQSNSGDVPFVEQLASALASPTHTSFNMTFNALSVSVYAMFRTHTGGSEYRYHISKPLAGDSLAQMPLTMVFQSAEEMKEAFIDIVRILIIITIQRASQGTWYSSTPQTGELERAGSERPEMLRISLSQTTLLAEIFDQNQANFRPSKTLRVDANAESPVDLLASLNLKS